jgi:hypothetical protein
MKGWFSKRCALTWRVKDTKSSRSYFLLQGSTRRTAGTEFGLLPTVTTQEAETPCQLTETGRRKSGKDSRSLNVGRMASMGMLPTPMAQEHDKITGKENQDSLTKRARQQTGKTSQLSPLFVEEMMGFPKGWTASPFQSGEENP